jgi:hypothetical protein
MLDRRSHETIRANMERKARQYELLKRGGSAGLSEAQIAEHSVDVRVLSELDAT